MQNKWYNIAVFSAQIKKWTMGKREIGKLWLKEVQTKTQAGKDVELVGISIVSKKCWQLYSALWSSHCSVS